MHVRDPAPVTGPGRCAACGLSVTNPFCDIVSSSVIFMCFLGVVNAKVNISGNAQLNPNPLPVAAQMSVIWGMTWFFWARVVLSRNINAWRGKSVLTTTIIPSSHRKFRFLVSDFSCPNRSFTCANFATHPIAPFQSSPHFTPLEVTISTARIVKG